MAQDIRTTAEYAEADALPRKYDAHTKGCGESGEKTLPGMVTRRSFKQKSDAEWAYERLILYIQNIE